MHDQTKSLNTMQDNPSVSYDVDIATDAFSVFIFAHGAGADKDHPYMLEISQQLVQQGVSVVRFNFPFMIKKAIDGKRRPPDRMPALLKHYQAVIERVLQDEQLSELPIIIGGKSMGSRAAFTLLNENISPRIKGGIAIGYPFHPQKKPDTLRLEPVQGALLPLLICQGERDALGSQAEINSYQLASHCQLSFFADGDHDLKPRVKSGFTHQQHKIAAVKTMLRFMREHN